MIHLKKFFVSSTHLLLYSNFFNATYPTDFYTQLNHESSSQHPLEKLLDRSLNRSTASKIIQLLPMMLEISYIQFLHIFVVSYNIVYTHTYIFACTTLLHYTRMMVTFPPIVFLTTHSSMHPTMKQWYS